MKYLSDYMEPHQTKLFEECGVFFAFSQEQFEKGKKEGVEYVSLGAGTICPEEHAKHVVEEICRIADECVKQDLEENGKDAVIHRELANHECWYTGCIEDCCVALADYPITREEIVAVYRRDAHMQDCG